MLFRSAVTITNVLGAKTWQEFVALAKANPGKYWYGSSGLGTITHLTGEVLTRTAGIQMQHSPYKTIVDATGDVFDGRIQMVFDPSFVPYAKSGKVRVVLTDGPARMADFPDVPTARELVKDPKDLPILLLAELPFRVARPYMAPPDVPADRVEMLKKAFMEANRDPAYLEEARRLQIEIGRAHV